MVRKRTDSESESEEPEDSLNFEFLFSPSEPSSKPTDLGEDALGTRWCCPSLSLAPRGSFGHGALLLLRAAIGVVRGPAPADLHFANRALLMIVKLCFAAPRHEHTHTTKYLSDVPIPM